MNNLVFSTRNIDDFISDVANEVVKKIELWKVIPQQSTDLLDKPLNIQEAAEFLHLSVPTIYSKVSKRELPVMKRSKRLYFSLSELTQYLKAGRRETLAEITDEADKYLIKKKGLPHGK